MIVNVPTVIRWGWSLGAWLYRLGPCRKASVDADEKATVIILSYKRPENIQPIVRKVLKCNFVEKILISNNNPEIKLEDYVNVSDERIVLINHQVRMRAGYRWMLAKQENADYFIAIDDDVFIYPKQLCKLFTRLIEEPDIPHGLFGSIYQDLDHHPAGEFRQCQESRVDVIHQIYAVTNKHVNMFFKLMERIRENNPSVHSLLDPTGDDIVISHTGLDKPKIHDVGFVYECPTWCADGIATCKEEDFIELRKKMLKEIGKQKYSVL
jgi:hypothetical protein